MSVKRKRRSAEESGEFNIELSGLTKVTDDNGKVYYFQPSGTYGHNTSKRISGSKSTPKKVGIVFEVPSWDDDDEGASAAEEEKKGGKHKRKTHKRRNKKYTYRKKRRS